MKPRPAPARVRGAGQAVWGAGYGRVSAGAHSLKIPTARHQTNRYEATPTLRSGVRFATRQWCWWQVAGMGIFGLAAAGQPVKEHAS